MRERQPPIGLLLACLLLLSGCTLSPLARNTAQFSSATSSVVENTRNAYRAAVRLNEDAQYSLLVARYDTDHPLDPHSIRPLIDEKGLEVRTEVLDGLRVYAQTIADLSSGVSSPKLDEAAAACGANLRSLGDALSGATPVTLKISGTEANAASTALKALGDLLIKREIKESIPKIIRDMDPNVDTLTKLLSSDIDVLRDQAGRDYEQILAQQDQFIRHAGSSLPPVERRTEIQRLPQILADKKATEDMLRDLQASLQKLAVTHHALAAAATTRNDASLQARIADLRASAEGLADFYESLSKSK